MSVLAHIKAQPFVAATAAAALVHSSWSLGTLFSGVQPAPPVIGQAFELWFVFFVKTLAWHIPAVSIAFAFDVGQVVTAHEIRNAHGAGRTPYRKYVTFVVFAAATYYLQMLYAAHHFPNLALGAGVSADHRPTVQAWLDVAVWVIPMFLPLSTLLYTFSGDSDETPANAPISHNTAPAAPTIYASPESITATPLQAAPALAIDAPSDPLSDTRLIAAALTLEDVGLLEAVADAAPIAEVEQVAALPDYTERAPLPFDDTKPAASVKATAKPRKPAAPPQTQNTLF